MIRSTIDIADKVPFACEDLQLDSLLLLLVVYRLLPFDLCMYRMIYRLFVRRVLV
mgnify:CR=1 FL=1